LTAAALGEYVSRTLSQSTPPIVGSKCFSFTVRQTMSKVCCRISLDFSPGGRAPTTTGDCAGCRDCAHAPPKKRATASANDVAKISLLLINRSNIEKPLLNGAAGYKARAIIPYEPLARRFRKDRNGGWWLVERPRGTYGY